MSSTIQEISSWWSNSEEREHTKVAEALLECGANAKLLDQSRRTPLHLASEHGYLDVAQRLLDRGADAHAQDKHNVTPLHLASQKGRLKVVQLLLSCSVDPNTRGENDQTALHLALGHAPRYVFYVLIYVDGELIP